MTSVFLMESNSDFGEETENSAKAGNSRHPSLKTNLKQQFEIYDLLFMQTGPQRKVIFVVCLLNTVIETNNSFYTRDAHH